MYVRGANGACDKAGNKGRQEEEGLHVRVTERQRPGHRSRLPHSNTPKIAFNKLWVVKLQARAQRVRAGVGWWRPGGGCGKSGLGEQICGSSSRSVGPAMCQPHTYTHTGHTRTTAVHSPHCCILDAPNGNIHTKTAGENNNLSFRVG